MAQYIEKSAIVAKIEERLKALANTSAGNNEEFAAIIGAQHYELMKLAQYIDTLEVKNVDLENYVHGTIDYPIIGNDFPNIYPNYKELKNYCDKNRIMDNNKVRLIIVKEDM